MPCKFKIIISVLVILFQDTSPSTSQKVALLTCELRKSESSKKTYEVATEKLLQFAEVFVFKLIF